jgi:hypothetical protein
VQAYDYTIMAKTHCQDKKLPNGIFLLVCRQDPFDHNVQVSREKFIMLLKDQQCKRCARKVLREKNHA